MQPSRSLRGKCSKWKENEISRFNDKENGIAGYTYDSIYIGIIISFISVLLCGKFYQLLVKITCQVWKKCKDWFYV